MKTKIIITHEASVNANGEHINGNSKAVYNKTTMKFYPSMKDAAIKHNVTSSAISQAVNNGCKSGGCYWCKAVKAVGVTGARQTSTKRAPKRFPPLVAPTWKTQ